MGVKSAFYLLVICFVFVNGLGRSKFKTKMHVIERLFEENLNDLVNLISHQKNLKVRQVLLIYTFD